MCPALVFGSGQRTLKDDLLVAALGQTSRLGWICRAELTASETAAFYDGV